LVYFASIPGKGFTGFLMEIIGRRWTIAYSLAGSLPGLFLMLMAHLATHGPAPPRGIRRALRSRGADRGRREPRDRAVGSRRRPFQPGREVAGRGGD
jgi:hypothetical protein